MMKRLAVCLVLCCQLAMLAATDGTRMNVPPEPKGAEEILLAELQTRPEDVTLWRSLAEHYEQKSQEWDALQVWQHLTALRPDDAEAWEARARHEYELGYDRNCRQSLLRLRELAGDTPAWCRTGGRVAAQLRLPDEAAANFRRTVELTGGDPGDEIALLLESGLFQHAELLLNQWRPATPPEQLFAAQLAGDLAALQGKREEALAAYRAALLLSDGDAWAECLLFDRVGRMWKLQESEEFYRWLFAFLAEHPERRLTAELLCRQLELADRLPEWFEALTALPAGTLTPATLARLPGKSRIPIQAATELERQLRETPEEPELHYQVARTALARNDIGTAAKRLEEFQRLAPDPTLAQARSSRLLREFGLPSPAYTAQPVAATPKTWSESVYSLSEPRKWEWRRDQDPDDPAAVLKMAPGWMDLRRAARLLQQQQRSERLFAYGNHASAEWYLRRTSAPPSALQAFYGFQGLSEYWLETLDTMPKAIDPSWVTGPAVNLLLQSDLSGAARILEQYREWLTEDSFSRFLAGVIAEENGDYEAALHAFLAAWPLADTLPESSARPTEDAAVVFISDAYPFALLSSETVYGYRRDWNPQINPEVLLHRSNSFTLFTDSRPLARGLILGHLRQLTVRHPEWRERLSRQLTDWGVDPLQAGIGDETNWRQYALTPARALAWKKLQFGNFAQEITAWELVSLVDSFGAKESDQSCRFLLTYGSGDTPDQRKLAQTLMRQHLNERESYQLQATDLAQLRYFFQSNELKPEQFQDIQGFLNRWLHRNRQELSPGDAEKLLAPLLYFGMPHGFSQCFQLVPPERRDRAWPQLPEMSDANAQHATPYRPPIFSVPEKPLSLQWRLKRQLGIPMHPDAILQRELQAAPTPDLIECVSRRNPAHGLADAALLLGRLSENGDQPRQLRRSLLRAAAQCVQYGWGSPPEKAALAQQVFAAASGPMPLFQDSELYHFAAACYLPEAAAALRPHAAELTQAQMPKNQKLSPAFPDPSRVKVPKKVESAPAVLYRLRRETARQYELAQSSTGHGIFAPHHQRNQTLPELFQHPVMPDLLQSGSVPPEWRLLQLYYRGKFAELYTPALKLATREPDNRMAAQLLLAGMLRLGRNEAEALPAIRNLRAGELWRQAEAAQTPEVQIMLLRLAGPEISELPMPELQQAEWRLPWLNSPEYDKRSPEWQQEVGTFFHQAMRADSLRGNWALERLQVPPENYEAVLLEVSATWPETAWIAAMQQYLSRHPERRPAALAALPENAAGTRFFAEATWQARLEALSPEALMELLVQWWANSDGSETQYQILAEAAVSRVPWPLLTGAIRPGKPPTPRQRQLLELLPANPDENCGLAVLELLPAGNKPEAWFERMRQYLSAHPQAGGRRNQRKLSIWVCINPSGGQYRKYVYGMMEQAVEGVADRAAMRE